jgi:Domain of unknown function (DUF4279)
MKKLTMQRPKAKTIPAPSAKRFEVELFIVHPTLKPPEITASTGLRPKITHCVGGRRETPKGTELQGTYPDTRWRYSRRYRTKHQHCASKVDELLDRLTKRRAFLRELRATGGRACVVVQFLSTGYFGDEIPVRTLKKMAELDLDFGIESYAIP